MKFIIPAKTGSERCHDKNWRPFHGEQSLVDVLIEKLLRVVDDPRSICVSMNEGDPPSDAHLAMGVTTMSRPARLTLNSVPMSEVVKWHAKIIWGDDDLAWCQCINPLFDEYEEAIEAWNRDTTCDTLAVRYKIGGYVLDTFGNPMGMGFGPWAKPTQDVPPLYRWPATFQIVSRETAIEHGYMGTRPLWYNTTGPLIDIKTDEDFEAARVLYAAKQKEVAA